MRRGLLLLARQRRGGSVAVPPQRPGGPRASTRTMATAAASHADGGAFAGLGHDMNVLPTQVSPNSAEWKENAAHMTEQCDDLRAQLRRVHQGGGERAVAKHLSRGKLLARQVRDDAEEKRR